LGASKSLGPKQGSQIRLRPHMGGETVMIHIQKKNRKKYINKQTEQKYKQNKNEKKL